MSFHRASACSYVRLFVGVITALALGACAAPSDDGGGPTEDGEAIDGDAIDSEEGQEVAEDAVVGEGASGQDAVGTTQQPLNGCLVYLGSSYSLGRTTFRVFNKCAQRQYFRVAVAAWPDSGCVSVGGPRWTKYVYLSAPYPLVYQGLRSC